jgi:hypothetical protein
MLLGVLPTADDAGSVMEDGPADATCFSQLFRRAQRAGRGRKKEERKRWQKALLLCAHDELAAGRLRRGKQY